MYRVCAPCIKEPNYKASDLDSDRSMLELWEVEVSHVFKAKADAQGSGRHNDYTVSETASKVCVFSVKGPDCKASELDSDTGRLKALGGPEQSSAYGEGRCPRFWPKQQLHVKRTQWTAKGGSRHAVSTACRRL
jgi:hypothetical protein